jgi:hypothetical protein
MAFSGWEARMCIYNLDGTLKSDRRVPLTAAPDAATDLGAMDFPDQLASVFFVKLELRDSFGQMQSDNFYWQATPANPDNFAALDLLPTVALATSVHRHDDAGKCLLEVNLTNPTSTVALMAHIQLRRRGSKERVLPVYYSDNYVSLLPGESRTIHVEAASVDLHGQQPLVMLDGWNVTTAASDDLKPNVDALPSGWPQNGFGALVPNAK